MPGWAAGADALPNGAPRPASVAVAGVRAAPPARSKEEEEEEGGGGEGEGGEEVPEFGPMKVSPAVRQERGLLDKVITLR